MPKILDFMLSLFPMDLKHPFQIMLLNQSSDCTVWFCLISKKMSTPPNPWQSLEFWTDGSFKHLSTPQCNIIHLNRYYALPKTGNLFSLVQWKERDSETISLTFCSCIWALTTLNSADGGFWLATRSSVSMSQLSRDSRASWNLPQWRRASCNCAARWATWKTVGDLTYSFYFCEIIFQNL